MIIYWVIKWEDQFTPLDTACRQLRRYARADGWLFGEYAGLIYRVYTVGSLADGRSIYGKGANPAAYRVVTGGFGFDCDGIDCGIWVVQSEGSGDYSYMLVMHVGYAVHAGKDRYIGPKLIKPS